MPERIVVKYETGNKLRRDVFEDGKKIVEEYDYTDKEGNAVWTTITVYGADRARVVDTDTDRSGDSNG